MAKFCSQCGKALEEGEVCGCQQQMTEHVVQPESIMQPMNNNVEMSANSYENAINGNVQNVNMQQGVEWNPNRNAQQNAVGNPSINGQQNAAWNPNGNPQQNQRETWNPNGNGQQDMAWNQNENLQKSAELIKKEGMSVLNRTIRLLKKPVEEIKDMASSDNMMTGLSAVISNMVVILLISIICMVAVNVQLGEFSDFIDIPYVKIVFMAVLLSGIYDFGLAGSMFFTVKVFFRENTTFGKMLAVVGGKLLLDSVFVVSGCILMLLNGQLGMLVIALGMIFSSIVLIMGFYETSTLGSNQKVFAYFIAMLIFVIGLSILYYIIAESAINDITRAFKYLL